jgi:hypothetical protein
MKIALFGHAGGRAAGAVAARIVAGRLGFDGRKIEEVLVDQFA